MAQKAGITCDMSYSPCNKNAESAKITHIIIDKEENIRYNANA